MSKNTAAPKVSAAKSPYEDVAISHVTNYVNVRQEANTSSTVVGKIYNNCAATILSTIDGEDGKWYQIQSGSVKGYIKAQYFITGAEAEKIAKDIGTTYATVVNASSLRLHEKPDLESKTLTLLAEGAEYMVEEETDKFAKLSIDTDMEGYVSKDYIKTRVEFKQAVSVEEEAAKKTEDARLKQEAEEAQKKLEEAKREAAKQQENEASGVKETTVAANETTAAKETVSPTIEANPDGAGIKNGGNEKPTQATTAATAAATTAAPTTAAKSNEVGPGGNMGPGGQAVVSATRTAIVAYAKQFLGNSYVYGGTSLTSGTDCSGFTMRVYEHFGIETGRSSRDQAVKGKEIPVGNVQPGDLLFYANGDYINHVAMYIGGGQVIHASTSKTGIIISPSNYRTPCKAVTFLD